MLNTQISARKFKIIAIFFFGCLVAKTKILLNIDCFCFFRKIFVFYKYSSLHGTARRATLDAAPHATPHAPHTFARWNVPQAAGTVGARSSKSPEPASEGFVSCFGTDTPPPRSARPPFRPTFHRDAVIDRRTHVSFQGVPEGVAIRCPAARRACRRALPRGNVPARVRPSEATPGPSPSSSASRDTWGRWRRGWIPRSPWSPLPDPFPEADRKLLQEGGGRGCVSPLFKDPPPQGDMYCIDP